MRLAENSLLNNGKYHIVRALGQGGYGITYLATTIEEVKRNMGSFSLSIPVAIKEFFVKTYCVRDAATADVLIPTAEGKTLVPQLRDDFLREARAMSKMNHPNIVKVIDVFEDHQTVYYVMQHIEGSTLAEKVGGSGPLNAKEAQSYIFQAANAVAYLHERHLCHYDIKPSNIMITGDGRAVLIDFGISRHYNDEGMATTSRPVGYSSSFSSPEQRIGDIMQFSPTPDIYSLAATLFFMLTGKTPPETDEIRNGALNECPAELPLSLWTAIASGMNPDSSKRPQTVKEWLALMDDSTSTRPEKNVRQQPQTKPEKKKQVQEPKVASNTEEKPRRKWLWIAVPAIFISLLTILLYLFLSNPSGGTEKGGLPPARPDTVETPPPNPPQVGRETKVVNMRREQANNPKNSYTYTGTVIDSIPNGRGRAEFDDGRIYEGLFKDGLREDDNACFTDSSGNTFSGVFRNDSIVKGRITAKGGQLYYEGTFVGDKPFDGQWHDADGNVIYNVVKGYRY